MRKFTVPAALPDNLEMVGPIGHGSAGTLFRVKDITGKILALKIVNSRWQEKELHALTLLRDLPAHPSLTQIFQVGILADGKLFYTMEIADNASKSPDSNYLPDTLANRISMNCIPFDSMLQIFVDIAKGMKHLHDCGTFHGDIKPENIIFVNGQPKLADFGTLASDGSSGTSGFLAERTISTADRDCYALAKTLYCVWSRQDVAEYPALPESFNPCELRMIRTVYLKGCNPAPQKRFASADDFIEALLGAQQKMQHPPKRRLGPLIRILCLLFLIAAGIGIYMMQKKEILSQHIAPDKETSSRPAKETSKTNDRLDKNNKNDDSVILPGERLGEGIGNTSLTWTTGGVPSIEGENVKWLYCTDDGYDDNVCITSGGGGANRAVSWLQTTLEGPCQISYYYKFQSFGGVFAVQCDSDFLYKSSGNTGIDVPWKKAVYDIPEGNHTLRFTYVHSGTGFSFRLNGMRLDNFKVTKK